MNTEKYKYFTELLGIISQRSPLQMKRIAKHVSGQGALFWQRADTFVRNLFLYASVEEAGLKKEDVVEAYLKMCGDMFFERMRFQETGAYSCSNARQAYESIYSSEKIMTHYMYGLALSYFLWPNHYVIYDFFIHETETVKSRVKHYLEIGAGHGLFLASALETFRDADFTVVDISQACISMARKIVPYLSKNDRGISFYRSDIMLFDPATKFDFISMGEVLEHVEDPVGLLKKVRSLLSRHGRLYISTCCNSPAIDHIYLFRDIAQIRDLFGKTGFRTHKELALPVDMSRKHVGDHEEIESNYAAIIERV